MTFDVDCVVIGAGVVGIAVARAFQLRGKEVVLVEKSATFGSETSSRNSEVIHAGIYYEPGSLKARLCVRGNELLYEYCNSRRIRHRRIGKLIVATTLAEETTLGKYLTRATLNGVDDVSYIQRADIERMEPLVRARLAIFSERTGIIDSLHLMQSLLGEFQDAGGTFVTHAEVSRGMPCIDGITLEIIDKTRSHVRAQTVINSAGLHSPQMANRIDGFPKDKIPESHFAIGHYYTLSGPSPFNRLIYPIANNGGLGIHATISLEGEVRFGPDVRWREYVDYSFDDSRKASFFEAIETYFPSIRGKTLTPGYTGIRPKLFGPTCPEQDFVVQTSVEHGIPGLVNLFGIESPGLTACLAIAEHVAALNPGDQC